MKTCDLCGGERHEGACYREFRIMSTEKYQGTWVCDGCKRPESTSGLFAADGGKTIEETTWLCRTCLALVPDLGCEVEE